MLEFQETVSPSPDKSHSSSLGSHGGSDRAVRVNGARPGSLQRERERSSEGGEGGAPPAELSDEVMKVKGAFGGAPGLRGR